MLHINSTANSTTSVNHEVGGVGLTTGLRRASRVGLAVLALVLVVGATAPAAVADTRTRTITYRGSILLAHYAYNAVTATGAPCDPKSPLNGLDGVWYQIPTGSTHVTVTPAATLDVDVLLRRLDPSGSPTVASAQHDTCPSVGPGLWGTGFGHTVSGPVPAGATFLLVNGVWGTGTFTIEFTTVPAPNGQTSVPPLQYANPPDRGPEPDATTNGPPQNVQAAGTLQVDPNEVTSPNQSPSSAPSTSVASSSGLAAPHAISATKHSGSSSKTPGIVLLVVALGSGSVVIVTRPRRRRGPRSDPSGGSPAATNRTLVAWR